MSCFSNAPWCTYLPLAFLLHSPLLINIAVMICAASKAGPCHPAPNGEGGVSAVETAVLHLNCLLSSGQGQGSRYTLFVPVPLPHSVCLSLWRPPFISPILNRVPLLVMFPISFFVPRFGGRLQMRHTSTTTVRILCQRLLMESSLISPHQGIFQILAGTDNAHNDKLRLRFKYTG